MSISLTNLKRTLKPCFRISSSIPTKLSSQDCISSPYLTKSLSKDHKKKPEPSSTKIKTFHPNSSFVNQGRVKSSKIFNAVTSLKKKTPEQRLEQKLETRLKYSDPSEHFEVYKQAFSEVIRADRQFSNILDKIKSGYEQKIGFFYVQNLDDLFLQVKELKENCLKYKSEKNSIEKELKKVQDENLELSKNLDMTESLYLEVYEKMQKIYNSNLTEFTLNENTWKYVVSENKILRKKVENLVNENEELKFREKEYFRMIGSVKDNGVNVKEIVDKMEELRMECKKKMGEESFDSENLVSEPLVYKIKPASVPKLFMKFEKSEASDTDSYCSSNY